MSALSIFDPREAPKANSPDLPRYGEEAISTQLAHYSVEKAAETMLGEPTIRKAVITPNVATEWKTYCQLIVSKPESTVEPPVSRQNGTKRCP